MNHEFPALMIKLDKAPCPKRPAIGDLVRALEKAGFSAAPTQLINGTGEVQTDTAQEEKCECGAAATGTTNRGPGHSSWCPWSKP